VADAPKGIGDQLLDLGCRQGALVDAPARVLWLCGSAGSWELGDESPPDAKLVVASQDCDIKARDATEPFVEALVVTRTTDRGQIHHAKKGNSARRFLLQEDGDAGLIADGRRRVLIEKGSLLSARFTAAFAPDDKQSRRRFAEWLGGRYSRSAIPEQYVRAVHKPVVLAIERANAETRRRVDEVDEVLFRVVKRAELLIVEFVLLRDDGDMDPEDEAELTGWLEEVTMESGLVADVRVAFRTPATLSLHDYTELTRLELDHFSAE
jgi:hypothetical protein